MSVAELVELWRDRAAGLTRFAPSAAEAFTQAANDLETALREASVEALTLEEASAESGYSVDHLGRLVREGTIPNAGRGRAPRILRRDLPRKPKPAARPELANARTGGPSLARITRDAIATRTRRR